MTFDRKNANWVNEATDVKYLKEAQGEEYIVEARFKIKAETDDNAKKITTEILKDFGKNKNVIAVKFRGLSGGQKGGIKMPELWGTWK